jgi:predicted kinase
MSQLFVNIIGFNAAGKTTLAKQLEAEFGFSRVSGDDFLEFVYNNVAYFKSTPIAYRTERYLQILPLNLHYRLQLSQILLEAGQSIIFDGSGNLKEYRLKYLRQLVQKFPKVKTVIIWAQASETELMLRYKQRADTSKWIQMYQDRKKSFQPPTEDEADLLLLYTQDNYKTLEASIQKLLAS